jgi:hypothetical protein
MNIKLCMLIWGQEQEFFSCVSWNGADFEKNVFQSFLWVWELINLILPIAKLHAILTFGRIEKCAMFFFIFGVIRFKEKRRCAFYLAKTCQKMALQHLFACILEEYVLNLYVKLIFFFKNICILTHLPSRCQFMFCIHFLKLFYWSKTG